MGWLLHYTRTEGHENERPVEYIVLLDKEEVTNEDVEEWLDKDYEFARKAEVRSEELHLFPLETAMIPH